jgi:hypothetical protein
MPVRIVLMLVSLGASAACFMFGAVELWTAVRSSQQPEEIALKELIQRGGQGNPNILLKDFTIVEHYLIEKKFFSGTWTGVWVPVIPNEGGKPNAPKTDAIQVFLYSNNIGSAREVLERFDRPRLRGLINPQAPKPPQGSFIGEVFLGQKFPKTDPNRCIIIEEGKEPAGILKLGLFGVGCVFFLALTPGIWLLARELDKFLAGPYLHVEKGLHPGRVYALKEGVTYVGWKGPHPVDVDLSEQENPGIDMKVNRFALIWNDKDGLAIADTGRRVTRVNDVLIPSGKRIPLKAGDRVQFGKIVLLLKVIGPARPEPSSAQARG